MLQEKAMHERNSSQTFGRLLSEAEDNEIQNHWQSRNLPRNARACYDRVVDQRG